ncbi:MAG TPA: S8 family serine peptidase [Caldilineae bacterium]|nr:S8 family serine peptidase [Caldilineae bacterium]
MIGLILLALLSPKGTLSRAADEGASFLYAPHAPGEMLVGLKDLPARAPLDRRVAALAADWGAEVIERVDALGIARLRVPEYRLASMLAQMRSDPRVAWAEPNYLIHLDLTPDDPLYATHQVAYLGRLQVEQAWDVTTGRPEVVIAVLDTGVDMSHPDLAPGIWTNPGEVPDNGLDDDGNGFVDDVHGWDFAGEDADPSDDHGHGTHVAGIAAARINNALGIAGMAGSVTIMPVDVFNGGIGTYADLIQAIVYAADNGADVINMSLGALSYSRGEEAAVEYAWRRGVVLVAAAGNNGNEAWHYPAAHQHVIGVAATDGADHRAGFSSFGPFVSVSAPGLSVFSTYPEAQYSYMHGTSMATPHVSGLAALLLSYNPTLTNEQVRDLIESTADDLGAEGWDPYYGHGRINAARALAAAPPPPDPLPPPEPSPPSEPIWPEGCVDMIQDGSFEADSGGIWHLEGEAEVRAGLAFTGTRALHLAGVNGASGIAWQAIKMPYTTTAVTLAFAFRIENKDFGLSGDPEEPSRDRLRVDFQNAVGETLIPLLRTGNAADTVPDGLPWDEYLYTLSPSDLAILRAAGEVRLSFYGDNGPDSWPTDFYIDAVRLCVQTTPQSQWPYHLWFIINPP